MYALLRNLALLIAPPEKKKELSSLHRSIAMLCMSFVKERLLVRKEGRSRMRCEPLDHAAALLLTARR